MKIKKGCTSPFERCIIIPSTTDEENKMVIEDKEIKVNQYYSINGKAVLVTEISSLDVWYTIIDLGIKMICDRGVFCSIAKEIKL